MKKILILMFVLVNFAVGAYSMIDTLSLEDLVKDAEIIALIKVELVERTNRSPEGFDELKFLATKVKIIEAYKGKAKADENLIISTLSGIEDSPELAYANKYLVFLKKVEGRDEYQVCNDIQGCWEVDASGVYGGMGTGTTLEMLKSSIEAKKIK
ncbi:MAG: hypothetical protein JXL97_01330 [Bacteroidales bacterium]|nr:hypothetical protein [Bacteroidales bacterium]